MSDYHSELSPSLRAETVDDMNASNQIFRNNQSEIGSEDMNLMNTKPFYITETENNSTEVLDNIINRDVDDNDSDASHETFKDSIETDDLETNSDMMDDEDEESTSDLLEVEEDDEENKSNLLKEDDIEISSDKNEDKILGENGCPAYASIDNACVDFFFNVLPDTPLEKIHQLLGRSWADDSNIALRLIFNLGNVRKDGAGKADRINFYRSLLWLWKVYPDIVVKNAWLIPEHASLKCLLNIYMYIIHEEHEDSEYTLENQIKSAKQHSMHRLEIRGRIQRRRKEKTQRRMQLWNKFAKSLDTQVSDLRVPSERSSLKPWQANDPSLTTKWRSADIAEKYQLFCRERDQRLAASTKSAKQKKMADIKTIVETSMDNDNIRDLRNIVIEIFLSGLNSELKQLEASGSKKQIGGLFPKWAPKERGMHDKATGIAGDIMSRLFTDCSDNQRLMSIKYQQLLSKLRGAAQIPEHFVGDGSWPSVNYNRMPSRCRLLWGEKVFKKHDTEKYDLYLINSAKRALMNKKKLGVKTGAILPHELVNKVMGTNEAVPDDLQLNLQWWGLVRTTQSALSNLGHCLPMCDVSGSMVGEPIAAAVGLSMLLAEAQPSESAMHGKILTFESQPHLHTVKDIPDYDLQVDPANVEDTEQVIKQLGNFRERVSEVLNLGWGGSTNIEAGFDQILRIAKKHSLSKEFVSNLSLCIFSDMEFDAARSGRQRASSWLTMHEHLVNKFAAAGYPRLPRIVYWNLRSSRSQPIHQASHPGVVLLSGFSPALLTSFLQGSFENFTPAHQVVSTVSGKLYNLLDASPVIASVTDSSAMIVNRVKRLFESVFAIFHYFVGFLAVICRYCR